MRSVTKKQETLAPGRAFTLVELLVVLGILALLLSLVLPAFARGRAAARRIECAAHLREIGRGFALYANDNNGFVPRDHSLWRADRRPPWLVVLGAYLEGGDEWREACQDDELATRLLRDFTVYQCAEHPLAGQIPSTYVVNAFKFESDPIWDPDGPLKWTQVRNPANVILVAEAADSFGEESPFGDRVFKIEYHDVYRPGHLPRRGGERISDDRHNGRANLLYFDGSVRGVKRGSLELLMFDDGVRTRATEDVWDDFAS